MSNSVPCSGLTPQKRLFQDLRALREREDAAASRPRIINPQPIPKKAFAKPDAPGQKHGLIRIFRVYEDGDLLVRTGGPQPRRCLGRRPEAGSCALVAFARKSVSVTDSWIVRPVGRRVPSKGDEVSLDRLPAQSCLAFCVGACRKEDSTASSHKQDSGYDKQCGSTIRLRIQQGNHNGNKSTVRTSSAERELDFSSTRIGCLPFGPCPGNGTARTIV